MYPVAEGSTVAFLTVMNNIAAFVFLILPTLGVPMGDWVEWSTAGACLVSVVCMTAFGGTRSRSKFDGDEAAHTMKYAAEALDGQCPKAPKLGPLVLLP